MLRSLAWQSAPSTLTTSQGTHYSELKFEAEGAATALPKLLVLFRRLQLLSWPLTGLAALSVFEALLVSQVGRVTGGFYTALLGEDSKRRFFALFAQAAGWFLAAAAVKSCCQYIAQQLALKWRGKLTKQLQDTCASRNGYYWLQSSIDNLDQRLIQDVSLFCTKLGDMLPILASAPFQTLFYSIWVSRLAGRAMIALYFYFVFGAVVQRVVVVRLAALVYSQEQREGAFRIAHARLRFQAEQVALAGGGPAEAAHLDHLLQKTLANQQLIVLWSWLLAAITAGLDYFGSLVTYLAIAYAVWSGIIGAKGDQGKTAGQISVAAFAMLSLAFSFSQVLDLSDRAAALLGLATRVSQPLEALDDLPESAHDLPLSSAGSQMLQHPLCKAAAKMQLIIRS
ncbi:hypothetical protein WJX73_009843 [Symbiochloris irregularis]|uniref:ABC transmembrane type-1 domain-containing protein n=1 Tax=Symbiochloris irregularis TaxID=706552 RepID=A0AAW1NPR3_9CHLO